MQPTLQKDYKERVVPALKESLEVKNIHEVPKIQKIVLNCCMGSAADRSQAIEDAEATLVQITGQKPVVTKAKISVSNFKLREGNALGAVVTLRGRNMYEFLERLIHIALPKVRDFRGISPKSFDGNGNYTLGISDHTIFPEIELEHVKRNIGFDVTIVTSARNNDEGRALLKEVGMPFREPKKASDSEA